MVDGSTGSLGKFALADPLAISPAAPKVFLIESTADLASSLIPVFALPRLRSSNCFARGLIESLSAVIAPPSPIKLSLITAPRSLSAFSPLITVEVTPSLFVCSSAALASSLAIAASLEMFSFSINASTLSEYVPALISIPAAASANPLPMPPSVDNCKN